MYLPVTFRLTDIRAVYVIRLRHRSSTVDRCPEDILENDLSIYTLLYAALDGIEPDIDEDIYFQRQNTAEYHHHCLLFALSTSLSLSRLVLEVVVKNVKLSLAYVDT